MGKNAVPDRWLKYSPMGSVVPDTRFIACKVPLQDAFLRRLPVAERFGPNHLMEAFPKLGLLVDLTNTNRYYPKEEFTRKSIKYEKIFCPGQVIPPNSIVKRFFEAVDQFLEESKGSETLIVVHCTHGVNRTGYLICRYMIEKLNIPPENAVERFQQARGHKIERQPYVDDLKNGCKGGSEANLSSKFSREPWVERKIEKRKIRRERKKNPNDNQPDCLNFYNWRAKNCEPDEYRDDLSGVSPQYKKMKDASERNNEYVSGFKSASLHNPRYPSMRSTNTKSPLLSHPYEYPKPLFCYQNPGELTRREVNHCQSVRSVPETLNSEHDLYKAKQPDYYRRDDYRRDDYRRDGHANHYLGNSMIRHDVAGLQISEPGEMASHLARHSRNSNPRPPGPSRGQGRNSQFKTPVENASGIGASRVPQHSYRSPRPTNPQPSHPYPSWNMPGVRSSNSTELRPRSLLPNPYPGASWNIPGVRSSNSTVQRPRSHFTNGVWQRPDKPTTDVTQQPQNPDVR